MNEVAKAILDPHASSPADATSNAPAADVFVINLCASMTPMPSVPKTLAGFEEFKLYQVSRVEDGRRRYRLRLGFFRYQAEAELLLAGVRALYPAAFSTAAAAEDLRFFGEVPPAAKTQSPPPRPTVVSELAAAAKVVPAPAVQEAPAAPRPQPTIRNQTAKPAASSTGTEEVTRIMPAPRFKADAATATPAAVAAVKSTQDAVKLEFALSADAAAPVPADDRQEKENKPFHVARGITVPEFGLELAPESTAKSSPPSPGAGQLAAKTPTAPVATKSASNQSTSPARVAAPASIIPGVPPTGVKVVDDYVPILDTTLTIRTLTQTEKDNPNEAKWYSVELASSEHPFNLEAMPRLDIFAAYRLYSVVVSDGAGKLRHALRLGFFREEVSADAVSGYLKTFFPTPIITRIGVAEYNRFAEPKPKPAPEKPAAEAAATNVVKLSEKREHAPAATPPSTGAARPTTTNGKVATATARKDAGKNPASDSAIRMARPQSFLARLIGRDLD